MTIAVSVRHRLGGFLLDAAFESAGRLTALFGSSGSGKTSLVNVIGGLVRPDEGSVVVDGKVLVDSRARIAVPAHRRRIGYVFQDARLFPHLTVRQNLGYGRFFTPARERYADFGAVVDLLGIGHLLDRRPANLSGGEKQRVAIGRALVASPRLILMDEPLASLDDARRAEILPFIERLRDEARVPIVYVSHSVAEVARLASDVVVLAGGRVAASGPPGEVLSRLDLLPISERSEGGAVWTLQVESHQEQFGLSTLRSGSTRLRVPLVDAPVGAPVRVRIRPRDVMVALEEPRRVSALNLLAATVVAIVDADASSCDVRLDCDGQPLAARITRYSAQTLGLATGMRVFAVVKSVTLVA